MSRLIDIEIDPIWNAVEDRFPTLRMVALAHPHRLETDVLDVRRKLLICTFRPGDFSTVYPFTSLALQISSATAAVVRQIAAYLACINIWEGRHAVVWS